MRNARHKRFYLSEENQHSIPKLQIKSGMVIEFIYRNKQGDTSRPLVLVMDTEEQLSMKNKIFHGVNLNYIPFTEVEKLFINIMTKTSFRNDRETNFPRVNLYEEEDPKGIKPRIIYKPFIKTRLMPRFDCWRSYKYSQMRNVKQIKFNFKSKKLTEVYKDLKE